MALSIKSDEADRLARELSAATGESITEAITIALEDRLARQRGNVEATRRRLEAIRSDLAGVRPDMTMTDEEILGFGDDGLPT